MKKTKLIIFDFDGVIIDSFDFAYTGTLRDFPDLTEEEHRKLSSGNIFESMEKMPGRKYSKEESMKWWIEVYNQKKNTLPIFDGMKDIIKILSNKFILNINTSSDSFSTKEYLKHNNIDFFDSIYGNDYSKNKKEKFLEILKANNVSADECFFVTDTVGDVLESIPLSIPTILVNWGYQNESHFDSVRDKVVGIASKPEDILSFINLV